MLGKLLGTRYKIIQLLGSGGFGQTYIVEDMQRPGHPRCVLKHLSFTSSQLEVLQQSRRLFYAEAATLEELGKHHPQIPQLLAYFEEEQEFYLVQEYIEGHPLSQELVWGTKWSEAQVIALLEDVLNILTYVHAQGVIHRDIKPDNLIRRQSDQQIVLIDFGAVKTIAAQTTELNEKTSLSLPVYTSGYAPSEQCLGRPQFSSDLYALGIVAIQALTGLRPTQFPVNPETAELIWQDRVAVSSPLAAILDKMVSYHFSQRYQSAEEVLQALKQIRDVRIVASLPALISCKPWQVVTGISLVGVVALTALLLNYRRLPLLAGPQATLNTVVGSTPVTQNRISWGATVLTPGPTRLSKQKGVDQVATGHYAEAVRALTVDRATHPTDPETLIYLNNARIGAAKAYAIAVVVPLGNTPRSAWDILQGVAQAQEQVNRAGGINGIPLKVAIANDDNQPRTAEQVAQTLVNQSAILGVVGHADSDASLAAGQVYQAGQLVMISPASSAVQLAGFGSYVFRTIPTDRFTARALSDYMLTQLKKKRAAVFFNSASKYSQSLKEEFKNALFYSGVAQVITEVDLSSPTFDAYEMTEQVIKQGADVMMLASHSDVSDRALQVVQLNRQRLPILAGDSIYGLKVLQVGGEAAVGMVLAVPLDVVGNAKLPFQQQAVQLWGAEANWRAALAYDATQALIAAIQQDPTRRGIRRSLSATPFSTQGATGEVRFLASGDREGPVQLVTIVRTPTTKSGMGYQFQPLSPSQKRSSAAP